MDIKPAKVKQRAQDILHEHNLEKLASAVKKSKKPNLEIFFTAKTHKFEIPFRAIVTERCTWQREVSTFLQTHLQNLVVCDPFIIPNSDELVNFLKVSNPGACGFFSIDVQDLYYSMPFDDLLNSVRLCITEDNDEIRFSNNCGVSVNTFMEVLFFYLESTFVEWKGKFYVKKKVYVQDPKLPLCLETFS